MTEQRNLSNNFFQQRNAETRTSRTSTSTTSSSTTTTSTSSTSTSIPPAPGVYILTDEQWEDLAYHYEECGIGMLTAPVIAMIREFNERDGIQFEVIKAAIYETGLAPRPTAHYLRAVLNRASGDGIQTFEEWEAAKKEYQYNVRKRWFSPSKYR